MDQSLLSKRAEESDESLMVRFQAGSEAAFELLFDRYSSHAINFAYRFLNSRQEAEDIAQEVFLRIYRAKERYDPKRSFRTWFFSIAARLISNQRRFEKRHPKEPLENTSLEEEDHSFINTIADSSCPPSEELLEKKQLARQVQQALKELPKNQRIAILLARFEEMSYEEIAKTMDIPVTAVKSLLFRARQTLKRSLASHGPQK